jgi:hypothetical protein
MSFKDNLDIDVLRNFQENNCLNIFVDMVHGMNERVNVNVIMSLIRKLSGVLNNL